MGDLYLEIADITVNLSLIDSVALYYTYNKLAYLSKNRD
jgi:hypothetical protein